MTKLRELINWIELNAGTIDLADAYDKALEIENNSSYNNGDKVVWNCDNENTYTFLCYDDANPELCFIVDEARLQNEMSVEVKDILHYVVITKKDIKI